MSGTTEQAPDPASLLSPLRTSRAFRVLFVGQLATQTAIWVLTVAAQVTLVQEGQSTLVVALVQSAVTLPFLIVAIPSGVMADLVSRRAVLVGTNAGAVVVGSALTALSASGHLAPATLLTCTFLLGLAWAVNAPTYTATVPDVVAREYIPAASMLASINFNAARVVGPAIGGMVIALLSPTVAFALSTLGYAVFSVAALTVEIPFRRSASRRFIPALRTGFRHVVNAGEFRRLVVVTGAWFVAASVLFALLPVVALRELGLGPGAYGWVLALVGGGAIVGTILLAPVRAKLQPTRFVAWVIPVFALCLVAIGQIHVPWLLYLVLPVTGASFTVVGAVLLALAQQMLPSWVRARGMSYYLMASQGGMAAGSFLWGLVGGRSGVAVAFTVAALALAPVWIVAVRGRFPVVSVGGDAPSWPVPEHDLADDMLHRRARVVVTWSVPDVRRDEFLEAMRDVKRSRRRTGGREWSLAADVEHREVYVESFMVDSWHDHLEQHEVRQSPEDAEASAAVRAIVGSPREIRHYVELLD